MKNRVLIVVEEIDVRARIARVLTRSGYAVELASNEKRALKLASDQQISTAIVGLGSGLAGFAIAQELRDAVPKLLVLAETSKDMTRLNRSFPEADGVLLKSSSEEELVGKLAEMIAVSARTADDAAPLPTILWIENCQFDLAAHVFIDAQGRELPLTRAEYAVLKDLASSPGNAPGFYRPRRRSVRPQHRHARRPATAQDRTGPQESAIHHNRARSRVQTRGPAKERRGTRLGS